MPSVAYHCIASLLLYADEFISRIFNIHKTFKSRKKDVNAVNGKSEMIYCNASSGLSLCSRHKVSGKFSVWHLCTIAVQCWNLIGTAVWREAVCGVSQVSAWIYMRVRSQPCWATMGQARPHSSTCWRESSQPPLAQPPLQDLWVLWLQNLCTMTFIRPLQAVIYQPDYSSLIMVSLFMCTNVSWLQTHSEVTCYSDLHPVQEMYNFFLVYFSYGLWPLWVHMWLSGCVQQQWNEWDSLHDWCVPTAQHSLWWTLLQGTSHVLCWTERHLGQRVGQGGMWVIDVVKLIAGLMYSEVNMKSRCLFRQLYMPF